jgi:L-ascorbate metabolism protein UlaG (beta-lactamase superfamily)
MNRSRAWILTWALLSTALLVVAVGWPDATHSVVDTIADGARPRIAQAQSPEAPAQLEWLGWQFFRLTSLTGKIILFNPALNDQSLAGFRNLESPVKLDDIPSANVILPSSGHGDDQGHTVEIARKTGAPVVTTFELATWMVARGVDTQKILRGQPGSRFDVDGIKIQVVNAVHGTGAGGVQGQTVYGGPALGFIVTLENGVKIYHAGSTAITQDLALYGRLYKPHIALLPIASGMFPDEAAIAAEMLMTDNPNLHSVFPQHHAGFLPADRQGPAFVKAVRDHRYRRALNALDPKPGQVFLVTGSGVRAR